MDEAQPTFRFSRESRIRIDAEGHFWHEGERVEHPRLERALASWIDLDDASGRYVLRNDRDWCFVAVDDVPLVVRNVWVDDKARTIEAELSDGTRETVVLSSLRVNEDGVPYCDVRKGRIAARFDRASAFALMQRAEEGPRGELLLRVGDSVTEVERVRDGGARTSAVKAEAHET